MQGGGSLTLTGHLGDVMKESARTALSWFRAHAPRYGVDPAFYKDSEIHLHVPSGAIPKDGPSAGVTMVTALASELTGRPVRGDLAMTGEITLSGRVLPVGGIKEKVLAARRHGISEVILPRQNEKNINEDLTEELRRELTIHYVVAHRRGAGARAEPSCGADAHRAARRDSRTDGAVTSSSRVARLGGSVVEPRPTRDQDRQARSDDSAQIIASPTTVFMSMISPRRTISRASASAEHLRPRCPRPRRAPPPPPARSAPTAGRRTSPRRSSRASGTARPSRTIVSGTWPISSWHSRRAASSGCLPFVHAAGRQFPQPAVDRVAVLPDQDDVARLGHRQQHHRRRVPDDVDRHLAPVRHAHAVAIDVEDLAVEDAFGGRRSAQTSVDLRYQASASGGSGHHAAKLTPVLLRRLRCRRGPTAGPAAAASRTRPAGRRRDA